MKSTSHNEERMSSPTNSETARRTSRLLLAGVFLVSFSLLALEISLARVLSVMFSYHYVFIVISLALLGLGLGAVFVHRHRRRLTFGFTAALLLGAACYFVVFLLSQAARAGESRSGTMVFQLKTEFRIP